LSGKSARFNEILLRSIDAAITETLSTQVLTALYNHLAERYDITRDEIPYRLDSLYVALGQIFGFKAAKTLERKIAKHLCAEFNIEFPDTPDCTLSMYVEKAKEHG
jgi:hypothetical protein